MGSPTLFSVQGYGVIYRPEDKDFKPYEVIAPDGKRLRCGTTWHSVERAIRLDNAGVGREESDRFKSSPEGP